MLREQSSLQVWCLAWRRPRHVPRPDIPKQLQSCTRDASRERQPCPARVGVRDSVAQPELGPDHVWPCEVSGCYSWGSQKASPKWPCWSGAGPVRRTRRTPIVTQPSARLRASHGRAEAGRSACPEEQSQRPGLVRRQQHHSLCSASGDGSRSHPVIFAQDPVPASSVRKAVQQAAMSPRRLRSAACGRLAQWRKEIQSMQSPTGQSAPERRLPPDQQFQQNGPASGYRED